MRVDEPEYAEKIDLGKRCSRRTYVYFRFCLNHSYGVQSACRESEAVLQAILLNRVKKGSLGNASAGCLERDRLYACERGATESGFQKEGLERVSAKKEGCCKIG